jgi:hypothetical protein
VVLPVQGREFQSRRVLVHRHSTGVLILHLFPIYIFPTQTPNRIRRIASQVSREAFLKMSRRGRGFHGKHSGRDRGSKKNFSDPHKNPEKSLQDYVYYIGSAILFPT